jgi:hypothetical protein
MQADSPSASLRDCADSLASLHQRMDRFYAWASLLQVEHRDLKQRVGYLEGVVLQATASPLSSSSSASVIGSHQE